MFFPVLFDRFPFPAMLTSTLLKLADLFRTEYEYEANRLKFYSRDGLLPYPFVPLTEGFVR